MEFGERSRGLVTYGGHGAIQTRVRGASQECERRTRCHRRVGGVTAVSITLETGLDRLPPTDR
ncbi:hypothetical protein GCM10023086_37360 [Streptomyces venetus]|uniref:Uncharacterized protein n=1 Tax=Streptomyces venetus TaxID=1701086 RepID=A0ABP8G1S7_9ACTN